MACEGRFLTCAVSGARLENLAYAPPRLSLPASAVPVHSLLPRTYHPRADDLVVPTAFNLIVT